MRAILGLPVPNIRTRGAAASSVILAHGRSQTLSYSGAGAALAQPDTQLRLFGKPQVDGERRVGVALALADNIEQARSKASAVAAGIQVHYDNP